ncbi:hypothetical protein [Phenylobacterium sp.]|uniref:hypothetical protein n=1 Tax=Phenylobacterium sp. TaxID=1871053 RepID=UPI002731E79D|nr:hypothetical protein [Phenylobacterium sp.]MDP2214749.1 hypothetical protein [Phenylobacterium sp.]
MLEFEPQYPRLTQPLGVIAADNGDHHAERLGHAGQGTLIERRLRAGAEGLGAFELEEIETFLAGLSREDLDTLCTGEETDRLAIDAPVFVEAFLQRAFEGVGHG